MNPLLKNAMKNAVEVSYFYSYKSRAIDAELTRMGVDEGFTFEQVFGEMSEKEFEDFFIKIFGG